MLNYNSQLINQIIDLPNKKQKLTIKNQLVTLTKLGKNF